MNTAEIDPFLFERLINMTTGDPIQANDEILANAHDVYIFRDANGKQIGVVTMEIRRGKMGNSFFMTGAAAMPGHRSLTKTLLPFLEGKAKTFGYDYLEAVVSQPAQVRQLTEYGFHIHSHNLSKKVS